MQIVFGCHPAACELIQMTIASCPAVLSTLIFRHSLDWEASYFFFDLSLTIVVSARSSHPLVVYEVCNFEYSQFMDSLGCIDMSLELSWNIYRLFSNDVQKEVSFACYLVGAYCFIELRCSDAVNRLTSKMTNIYSFIFTIQQNTTLTTDSQIHLLVRRRVIHSYAPHLASKRVWRPQPRPRPSWRLEATSCLDGTFYASFWSGMRGCRAKSSIIYH